MTLEQSGFVVLLVCVRQRLSLGGKCSGSALDQDHGCECEGSSPPAASHGGKLRKLHGLVPYSCLCASTKSESIYSTGGIALWDLCKSLVAALALKASR